MNSQDVLRYVKPCWDDFKYDKPSWNDVKQAYILSARNNGKSLRLVDEWVERIVKYMVEKENNMINKNCESYDKCKRVKGKGFCDGCDNMFNGMFDEAFKKYVQHDIDTLVKTHGYVTFKKPSNPFAIKNVIFNPPATIVFWEDGTKTVVKAGEHDMFDPEKGLAMAISKRALGGKHDYYEPFAKWVGKYEYQCKKQMRKEWDVNVSAGDEWFSKWAKRQNESCKPMEEFE